MVHGVARVAVVREINCGRLRNFFGVEYVVFSGDTWRENGFSY